MNKYLTTVGNNDKQKIVIVVQLSDTDGEKMWWIMADHG